jgi:carbonic anhydrase/acetyltransferase-like protein (isoleucine patch superfamily)
MSQVVTTHVLKGAPMILTRNDHTPTIHPTAIIAPSAQIIGNVSIGAHSYVDYNVVIASSGAPIVIADHVIVLANTVIRSIGGVSRPAFPVHIGDPECVNTFETDLFRIQGAADWFSPITGRSATA